MRFRHNNDGFDLSVRINEEKANTVNQCLDNKIKEWLENDL